jgi:hypothetical protein
VSGQHCWHQKVTVTRAAESDRYGDILVDTNRAHLEYQSWMKLTRTVPPNENLRRPLWLPRPYRPALEAFYLDSGER